jgi:hypothetical protein
MKGDEKGNACGTYEEKRDTYRVLVGKFGGWSPLGRHARRWKIILKLILKEYYRRFDRD